MWIFLFIVCLLGVVGLSIWKRHHTNQVDIKVSKARRAQEEEGKTLSEDRIEEFRAQHEFPVPGMARTGLIFASVLFLVLGAWNQAMFYAEPGYKYHVRDIFGNEFAVDSVGYQWYGFGRYTPWKKAVSIVAKADYAGANEDDTQSAEDDSVVASATLGPVRTIFLDQVDAQVSATARFLLPSDEDSFLRIAREYRTPDNLLRTTLLPAFRETLQANSALMGAEDYFAGGRTQFNIDFEEQLEQGLFLVKRTEVVKQTPQGNAGSANASLETEQTEFGNDEQVVFVVEKIVDEETGLPVRKVQSFAELGVTVVESRITDVVPNQKFNERMQLKQKASADRAIAREQRIQEEEQRLLAEAKGEREVAERKAAALVVQIEQTTNAETEKQLALTEATKLKESAEIAEQTARILLEKAKIDAEAVQVAADAEAYQKREILEADNALAQKLEAEIAIQKVWAEAYAKRAVPQYVFGGTGGTGPDGTPVGSDSEAQVFMQMMTMQAAKQLNNDRSVAPGK